MAVSELGSIGEIEGWVQPAQRGFLSRVWSGLANFCRKKPLGAFCGVIVITFMIIGDLIPETLNKVLRTASLGDEVYAVTKSIDTRTSPSYPIPYMADQLEKHTRFI